MPNMIAQASQAISWIEESACWDQEKLSIESACCLWFIFGLRQDRESESDNKSSADEGDP